MTLAASTLFPSHHPSFSTTTTNTNTNNTTAKTGPSAFGLTSVFRYDERRYILDSRRTNSIATSSSHGSAASSPSLSPTPASSPSPQSTLYYRDTPAAAPSRGPQFRVNLPPLPPNPPRPRHPPHPRSRSPFRPPGEQRFCYFPPTPPPPALHHPNLDKMSMASVVAPQPAELPKIAGSMTTKEWVIPPRPKPGRKPATDTPPTKRKAQNRAAQRAFRERRAARVGELEEQLDEEKAAYEKKETGYKDRIRELEMEMQSFKSRCQVLEGLLERERNDRVKTETELEGLRRRWDDEQSRRSRSSHGTPTQLPSISSQFPPSHHHGHAHGNGHGHVHGQGDVTSSAAGAFTCGSCDPSGPGRCACAEEVVKSVESGCGKCGHGNKCECFEEAVASTASDLKDLKRAPSLSLAPPEKRQRAASRGPAQQEIEIDFTSFFRKDQPPQQQHQQPTMSSGPVNIKDPCGFCKDGDYCICADTAMAAAAAPAYTAPFSQQVQTPPPSDDDVVPPMPMEINSDGAVKLRPRPQPMASAPAAPASRGCGPGGPGTCAQCIADPISGLFCRALSANIDRKGQKGGGAGGCCGGGGREGGCCKSGGGGGSSTPASAPATTEAATPSATGTTASTTTKPPALKTGFGLSLSCAEAYQTLSSHRDFSKATDDLGSWLPKLRAAPRMGEALPSPVASARSSRMPIEVEAASIMSVLKDFDIRFGRGL